MIGLKKNRINFYQIEIPVAPKESRQAEEGFVDDSDLDELDLDWENDEVIEEPNEEIEIVKLAEIELKIREAQQIVKGEKAITIHLNKKAKYLLLKTSFAIYRCFILRILWA